MSLHYVGSSNYTTSLISLAIHSTWGFVHSSSVVYTQSHRRAGKMGPDANCKASCTSHPCLYPISITMIYLLPTCLSLTEKSPVHKTFPCCIQLSSHCSDEWTCSTITFSEDESSLMFILYLLLDYMQVDSIKTLMYLYIPPSTASALFNRNSHFQNYHFRQGHSYINN